MSKHTMAGLLPDLVPRLRRYARALTRSREGADDLVQDCLERAWAKAHRWEPGTDLRAWLFTVMHNVYVNRLRRRQPVTEPIAEREYPDPRHRSPDGMLDIRDLTAGIEQLPPEQKEVLMLVCLEDMSYAQAAEIIGVPVGTVMSRLHRARERLRQWMTEETKPALRRVK